MAGGVCNELVAHLLPTDIPAEVAEWGGVGVVGGLVVLLLPENLLQLELVLLLQSDVPAERENLLQLLLHFCPSWSERLQNLQVVERAECALDR